VQGVTEKGKPLIPQSSGKGGAGGLKMMNGVGQMKVDGIGRLNKMRRQGKDSRLKGEG
jgi:hypothetical protein